MENIANAMMLNLGCGRDYKSGYINIDAVKDFRADIYHDLSTPLPFNTNSIDYVRAKDLLEHFSRYDAPRVLKDWIRVLKYYGELELLIPNIEAIRSFTGDTFLSLMFGEQMFAGINTGNFGLHKWGYTKVTLTKLLQENGMEIIDIHEQDGTNLFCLSRKVGQTLHAM